MPKSSSDFNIFDLFDYELYINRIIHIIKKKYKIELYTWCGNLSFEESQDIIIK